MLRRLLKCLTRPIATPAVEALYRACVSQARHEFFYSALSIPDTVDGRFDLLTLHVVLVINRLRSHAPQTQQLFDIMFADMDRNLREMGVSDISISKKMKPMLAAFYGRAKSYEDALANSEGALKESLHRNIWGKASANAEHVIALSNYVRRLHEVLASQDDDALLEGNITFPVPQNA